MPRRRRISFGRGLTGTTAILAIGGLVAAGQAAAIAPAPPANSDSVSQSFSASPGAGIPDNTGQAVSTITVSGAKSSLRDIDVFTNIAHTSSGDLQILLKHTPPGGVAKEIMLVDTPGLTCAPVPPAVDPLPCGRDNPNWYAGTLWDDSGSTVVSDITLTNDSPGTKTSLVPEAKLAAFIGSNPNGTWTLTVKDRRAGDTGTLSSWRLDIASQTGSPPETASTISDNAPKVITNAIPDPAPPPPPAPPRDTPQETVFNLPVAGVGTYLTDLDVRTRIDHPDNFDLTIVLEAPNGTKIPLANPPGNFLPNSVTLGQIYLGTLWDDSASDLFSRKVFQDGVPATSLVPEGALDKLIGSNPNGTWKLRITDSYASAAGQLTGWDLVMKTTNGFATAPPTPTPGPTPGTVQISGETLCLPSRAATAKKAKVSLTGTSLVATQRTVRTAVARASAIEAWLKAGITTGDLCGGAFAQKDLSVGTGAGTFLQSITAPAPRPLVEAKVVLAKPRKGARVTKAQASAVLAQARTALRRAKALQARVNGGLTGGDIVDGSITIAKLNRGLVVTNRTGASAAASTTNLSGITVKATPKNATVLRRLQDAELYGRQATSILNGIRAKLQSGLTGAEFKDGSVGAADLA